VIIHLSFVRTLTAPSLTKSKGGGVEKLNILLDQKQRRGSNGRRGGLVPDEDQTMKLKLDLHPIFSDGRQIEASLQQIIEDAVEKHASEVEIITGKGSGALKKSVLRFLDRPDIKARYHRMEKDGDNWGRLFVHFRAEREPQAKAATIQRELAEYICFCCQTAVTLDVGDWRLDETSPQTRTVECPSCESPNRLTVRLDRRGLRHASAISGYE